jgi:signal transduction histidine kinase
LERIREGLGRIVEAGHRAGKVVDRIRALVRKAPPPPRNVRLNINEAILEVVELTRTEAVKNWILVQTYLAAEADRVQLQQVLLNLIVNAVEAMSGADDGRRELLISTREAGPHGVLVAVRDSGPGLTREAAEHLFDAFYTTKPDGLGMGLSICRSIIEAHGGRLWASANAPHGAIFEFSIAASPEIGG